MTSRAVGPVGSVAPRWFPRPIPLTPLAVVGVGPVALALKRRGLEAADAQLARWRGVAGAGVLVLLGDAETLPWVDGALYLGRDPLAPSLVLPCALRPEVPLPLWERALVAQVPRGSTPLAVIPDARWLVPLGPARPVHRATLQAWGDR
ncbi:hypothetical protein DRW03_15615 [Corallococcus sp. H22C18031201]|uniref:bpX5 domain-containing protein n=1 Tax=Citreicoccus inhibens TaxID=2849499 RepID=UPI000E754798|nr:hypothetical protein [Citreicoccus inhibens]MBU8900128.1 hypothetical protein [Citreicoccus inhibens]RJS21769.1 hypothetical protein DRW03_15615 [Corallococcus sp. H22C18031201]